MRTYKSDGQVFQVATNSGRDFGTKINDKINGARTFACGRRHRQKTAGEMILLDLQSDENMGCWRRD
jgi:hypothetical protein